MINNIYKKNTKKNQQTIFYHYFFVLFGFLGGNLWGSFFSSFSLPPFFFIIGILICLEALSYIYYKNIKLNNIYSKASYLGGPLVHGDDPSFFTELLPFHSTKPTRQIPNPNKCLYLLKVGLIFGLFVDAFKVGS